jgi:GNAT superfamily N-acetyltransferase
MTILIREALSRDADSATVVSVRAEGFLRTIYRPTEALTQAMRSSQTTRRQLVAICDDEVRGTVSFEQRGDCLHLQALAVDPDWQRRGVARALISHAKALADSRGIPLLSLYTVVETGNVTIFERLGFHVVSTRLATGLEPVAAPTLTEAYMQMPISACRNANRSQ